MIPLQLLVVRDASPQYVDILPYKKGQIITLLEKRFIHFTFKNFSINFKPIIIMDSEISIRVKNKMPVQKN